VASPYGAILFGRHQCLERGRAIGVARDDGPQRASISIHPVARAVDDRELRPGEVSGEHEARGERSVTLRQQRRQGIGVECPEATHDISALRTPRERSGRLWVATRCR